MSTGADPFAALMAHVLPGVERELRTHLTRAQKNAAALGQPVKDMVAALSSLCLRGGKRLRAGLVAAGYLSASGKRSLPAGVIQAGVAVELLQAYFLIHDDWMDRDDVRRGGPSVHAWLTAKIGNSHQGAAAGVLTGDYALALATQVLSHVPMAQTQVQGVWDCFSRMQLDAIAGQQRDLLGEEDVLLTYKLKTGSYSVHGPLELGARLGGASLEVLGALKRYAIPTGVAFQLRDDLLNAFGDPAVTGKPLGSDLVEGKKTLLVSTALGRLKGPEKAKFLAAFGNPKATQKQRAMALQVLGECGAVESLEREISKLCRASQRALASGALPSAGRELLAAATTSLVARTH